MTQLQEVERLLAELSAAEKAIVLQWVARDLGGAAPGVESTPSISGGEPCIVRTRIPVWMLAHSRNLGMSEADILTSYPGLRAEDLINAWTYYHLYQAEIDHQIDDNEAA